MNEMKNTLKTMGASISDEFKIFEEYFEKSLLTDVKLINSVIRYVVKRKGKRFRPKLCLLSAGICGDINENTYRASSLIEMIHVATLIHDDIVDDADLRRGWPSINRVWKSKIAVLIGDYLFSNALSKMCDIDSWDALKVLSKTAKRLSRGEIMQVESAASKNMNEEEYFKMIKDKTASLISASTIIGAITATDNKEKQDAMFRFGEKLGTMFQLKDDLLDITGLEREVGKPTMFDLKKNMLTLPLIYIISKKNNSERKRFISDLKYLSRKNKKSDIKGMIIEMGGVRYTEDKITELSEGALKDLDVYENGKYKDSLKSAIDFNMNRKS